MFTTLQGKSRGKVSFGNSGKLRVIGVGDITVSEHFKIRNVLLVKSMPFNLISVSQLYVC